MILTILFVAVLGVIAFGLTRPLDPRRLAIAAAVGAIVGAIAAYFNIYPGSIRGALTLLAIALFVSGSRIGMQFGERTFGSSEPLIPRAPVIAGVILIVLIGMALFPYTEAGADSVSNPLFGDLNANIIAEAAPPLKNASDVRVVPWVIAAELSVRAYQNDASFLDTSEALLLRNTFPDTVRGEFIWVHAPTPEASKWIFGGRTADKVVYVRNNASVQDPEVVPGTLNVHVDGRFWHDRVQRYAENHGEFRWALQDVTLQLDDDYHPYWIAYLARIDLRSQPHMEKLIVVDAYTGEENVYDVTSPPDWVEQVYPESYVYYWAEYWGAYREGIMYRWFDAQGLVQPDDVTVRYIQLEGQTYWLLPMRQLNAPQLGGYVLVNTRSGDATFFDRSSESLVDYTTAYNQLQALMASGEATGGQGQIRLSIHEGYIYPIPMQNGEIREAYVFPLLADLKVASFGIIDARNYTTMRVIAPNIQRAISSFANLSGDAPSDGGIIIEPGEEVLLRVLDGVVTGDKALVNLNGTHYRVTPADLESGQRREATREMDELELAIARANRGEDVEILVRFDIGRIVDVTYPGVTWG